MTRCQHAHLTMSRLVAELYRRGVSYWTSTDGRLHLEAPVGALTDELRRAILDHRDDLLVVCAGTPIWGMGQEPPEVDPTCDDAPVRTNGEVH